MRKEIVFILAVIFVLASTALISGVRCSDMKIYLTSSLRLGK